MLQPVSSRYLWKLVDSSLVSCNKVTPVCRCCFDPFVGLEIWLDDTYRRPLLTCFRSNLVGYLLSAVINLTLVAKHDDVRFHRSSFLSLSAPRPDSSLSACFSGGSCSSSEPQPRRSPQSFELFSPNQSISSNVERRRRLPEPPCRVEPSPRSSSAKLEGRSSYTGSDASSHCASCPDSTFSLTALKTFTPRSSRTPKVYQPMSRLSVLS